MVSDTRIGFLLWPQTDCWPAIRDAAVRAEQAVRPASGRGITC